MDESGYELMFGLEALLFQIGFVANICDQILVICGAIYCLYGVVTVQMLNIVIQKITVTTTMHTVG